jgi:hypothetical protein
MGWLQNDLTPVIFCWLREREWKNLAQPNVGGSDQQTTERTHDERKN